MTASTTLRVAFRRLPHGRACDAASRLPKDCPKSRSCVVVRRTIRSAFINLSCYDETKPFRGQALRIAVRKGMTERHAGRLRLRDRKT